jgi:hypothetical protein
MQLGGLARATLTAAMLANAASASAARPFNTDDARIVEPGGYQIESYVKDQRRKSESEFWFLPAHNFGGALDRMEWTLGGNVIHSDRLSNSNLVVAQVKTLLKPLPENGIGFAVTVGVGRLKPGVGEDVPTQFGPADVPDGASSSESRFNPFLNLISSVSLAGGQFVIHANGGLTRETREDLTQRNWGFGAEIFGLARIYPIAEMYGISGEKPATQVGVRYWARPQRLQIDGTYGWQSADPTQRRWVSVGLRVLW